MAAPDNWINGKMDGKHTGGFRWLRLPHGKGFRAIQELRAIGMVVPYYALCYPGSA